MSSGKWQPFCLGLNVLNMSLYNYNKHLIVAIDLTQIEAILAQHKPPCKTGNLKNVGHH